MRLRLLLFFAAFAAGAGYAGNALAADGRATTNVNMRSCASAYCASILVVPAGAPLTVYYCNTWCRVRYGGWDGYVYSAYVAFEPYYPPVYPPIYPVLPPFIYIPPPDYQAPLYRPPFIYRPPPKRPPPRPRIQPKPPVQPRTYDRSRRPPPVPRIQPKPPDRPKADDRYRRPPSGPHIEQQPLTRPSTHDQYRRPAPQSAKPPVKRKRPVRPGTTEPNDLRHDQYGKRKWPSDAGGQNF